MTRSPSDDSNDDTPRIALQPEPGWRQIQPLETLESTGSFVSGEPFGQRLRVRYYLREADEVVVGKVWFGPGAQGPPGHAHGGCLAAILDEAMGAAAWIRGHYVLAVELTTRFRRRVPLGTVARIEASVERLEGRKVFARARLLDEAGEAYCTGESVNIRLSPTQLQQVQLTPLMEQWKRWGDGGG